jgi:hypothetical protein
MSQRNRILKAVIYLGLSFFLLGPAAPSPEIVLANRFSICAALYAPLPLLKVVNPGLKWGDHSPFWDRGYSALCGIEDYAPPNPYYHKTTDTGR